MLLPNRGTGHDLIAMASGATKQMEKLLDEATAKVRARVAVDGRILMRLFDREQRAAHALAWLATYVEAIRQLADYAEHIQDAGELSEIEDLAIRIALGEYLAQIFGGIPMSQGEMARPSDLGLSAAELTAHMTAPVETLIASGNTAQRRARFAELLRGRQEASTGANGVDDTLESIREEMRKFIAGAVMQQAQRWHLSDGYIPADILAQMADLGVFGLTIPEEFGGMGLGKLAMCIVGEELSRGYIGVGSLATRAELVSELILHHGTEEQKRLWLPKIAAGTSVPAAAFSEPNSGSDLASVRTRAQRQGDVYKIRGNKTWVTHAARADLMLLLVRTNGKENGHRGLSILIAEKPRGSEDRPFPAPGMTGGEIATLGYRGMKEFELVFDGFEVQASGLLGDIEGIGFKQLMETFETVRIQTAARSIGVAQSALDQAIAYSGQRTQFGTAIANFPRIGDKIAMMAAEIGIARQLTYFAARKKDSGARCDLEAAMAKMLGARVAWATADNALQIHGGNGLALEFPISRILCDARAFPILEGSAEIMAQVIARRLLDGAA